MLQQDIVGLDAGNRVQSKSHPVQVSSGCPLSRSAGDPNMAGMQRICESAWPLQSMHIRGSISVPVLKC